MIGQIYTLRIKPSDFIETPYSYYEVVDNKGTQIDFKGNSFVYKAKVTAGVFKEIILSSSSSFTLTAGFSKGTLTYPTNT